MAALVGLSLASCSHDEAAEPSHFPADGVIRVDAGVDGMKSRASYDTNSLREFGISVMNNDHTPYIYNNVMMSRADASSPWTSASQMLWRNATDSAEIFAYAPYQATALAFGSNLGVYVLGDQTSAANEIASDFIYAAKHGFIPQTDLNTNGKIDLSLRHAFSKLVITISLGTEFNEPSVLTANPVSNVQVDGTICHGSIKISGQPIPEGSSRITLSPILPQTITSMFNSFIAPTAKNVNGKAVYECIVIPQSSSVFSVSFMVNSTKYTWTAPAAVTFAEGTQYALSLIAGKDVVGLGAITATPWTETAATDITTE